MRSSFEFNRNSNKTRKQSWDKYIFTHAKNILNKKKRKSVKSMMNFEYPKFNRKSKINIENLNENEKKFYYSNANLKIIDILNSCINDDLYNDLSFNRKQKDILNEDKKIRFIPKKFKEKLDYSELKRFNSGEFNNKNYANKYFSSLSTKQFNKIRKTSLNNIFNVKEANPRIKKVFNKSFNKFKFHNNLGRKSLDLSLFNKKININLNNKFGKYYNYNNNEKSFISQDLNLISFNKKNDVKGSMIGDLSEIEIIKMNEHIFNDINLLQLKKKISKLKKTIKSKYSNNQGKFNNKEKIIVLHSINKNQNIDENEKQNENINEKRYVSNKIKKSPIKNEKNSSKNKYRKITRKANLFDSFDDEEYFYEEKDFYISPNSLFIKIFDIFIFISSFIYFIFIPYFLSQNYVISKKNNLFKMIFIFIDLIYIIEIIINFFIPYKNFDENLIKRKKKIITHYIKTWFLIDLIQAFPYFSLFNYLEKKYNFGYQKIYILLMIKAIKIYKIHEDNTAISYLSDLLSKNEIIDDNQSTIEIVIIFLCFLNITTCLYIFLGRNLYPSWILKINIQDESYLDIYLTSLYYIIVTITTVGYGDITGNTIPEILFQMLLLILGTIAYSFIISYFSNYIVKISQKSMNFEKKLNILNEIKLHHPNMKNTIYNEVLRNLHNEQFYEKKDKQLLFQCLPYSLKNKLIMEIYKPIIRNFIFFKDIDNSDFIVKVATSLKPLISIKGDILIREGDFIKEIFFIKKGVIGLNISIDLNNLEESIQKYFDLIKIEKFNISHIKSSIIKPKEHNKKLSDNNLDFFLYNKREDSSYNESDDNSNFEDINIIEIRNKEHFGDALMFLNERCPLNVIIRTKTAELLILKKVEAIEIYSIYPNIWKRINKKSLYNMEQIYLKTKRTLIEITNRYNIKLCKKNINKQKSIINKKQNNNNILKEIKPKKNNKKKKENNLVNNNKNKLDKKNYTKDKKDNNNEDKDKDTIKKNHIIKESSKEELKKESSKNMTFYNDNSNEKNSKNYEDSFKIEQEKTLNKNNIHNISQLSDEKIKKEEENKKFILSESKSSYSKIDNSKNDSENNFYKIREINNEIYENENFNINLHHYDNCILNKNNYKESFEEKKCNNLNDSNNNSSIKNKLSSRILIPNLENLYHNNFYNLSQTKENSIQLNSSYENINKISNYKYINNFILQNKTKQFITDECTNNLLSPKIRKRNAHLHNTGIIFPTIKINYEINKSVRNNMFNKMNDNLSNKKIIKVNSSNILNKLTKGSKEFEYNIKCKSEKSSPSNKQKKKINRANSQISFSKDKMSNILSPTKSKRKMVKKKTLIGKKLNVISKNIQNAKEAINNPNEFYMNFFNNIIKSNFNEEHDGKKKKSSRYLNSFSAAIGLDKNNIN